jgi:hypothetical protein
MTKNLHQEERTDSTEFDLFFNHDEGRLFLEIYTGTVHYMVELDENDLSRLQERLTHPPVPIERRDE